MRRLIIAIFGILYANASSFLAPPEHVFAPDEIRRTRYGQYAGTDRTRYMHFSAVARPEDNMRHMRTILRYCYNIERMEISLNDISPGFLGRLSCSLQRFQRLSTLEMHLPGSQTADHVYSDYLDPLFAYPSANLRVLSIDHENVMIVHSAAFSRFLRALSRGLSGLETFEMAHVKIKPFGIPQQVAMRFGSLRALFLRDLQLSSEGNALLYFIRSMGETPALRSLSIGEMNTNLAELVETLSYVAARCILQTVHLSRLVGILAEDIRALKARFPHVIIISDIPTPMPMQVSYF